MTVWNQMADAAATLADAVLQATDELAKKGKEQARLLALEHRLGRAQRQLGALVYALHKNGARNDALVARYLAAIAELEGQIAACGQDAGEAPAYCPQCGAQVDPDALFCPACGGGL